jgi:PTH1 family peptidyl-tRNA hydrolase
VSQPSRPESGKPAQADLPVRAIVALGNPGRKYADTRHNVGWMAVDALAGRLGVQWQQKFNGEFGRLRLGEHDLMLLKPGTFMNLSGHPVQAMCAFFGLKPGELLVLHDDLDLPFGRLQIKVGGGHGGHNGLRSIVAQVGADFARVRLGIGRPPQASVDVADWVLSTFLPIERAELPQLLDKAEVAVRTMLDEGVRAAMNACNGVAPGPKPVVARDKT